MQGALLLAEAGAGDDADAGGLEQAHAVELVGCAALGGGGLGVLINTGITLSLNSLLISGAALVALLALAIDWLGRVVEHVARPKGL